MRGGRVNECMTALPREDFVSIIAEGMDGVGDAREEGNFGAETRVMIEFRVWGDRGELRHCRGGEGAGNLDSGGAKQTKPIPAGAIVLFFFE